MKLSTRDIGIGAEIPSLSKMVALETSQAYSGWPEISNFHTDPEIAKKLGFPTVVMQGMLGASYLSQVCFRFFGASWARGGKLSVTFIKPIFPPQRLTARGVVKGKTAEADGVRLVLEVWLEDEQGQKMQVGTASALVPSA